MISSSLIYRVQRYPKWSAWRDFTEKSLGSVTLVPIEKKLPRRWKIDCGGAECRMCNRSHGVKCGVGKP